MKITLPYPMLFAAISHASSVSSKQEQPFILVVLRKDNLCFYGISRAKQVEACYRIPTTVEGVTIEGEPNFTVSADRFKRMLESAPNKESVTIEDSEENPSHVTLRFHEHKGSYLFASPQRQVDFQLLSSKPPKFTFTMNSQELSRVLDRTLPAVAVRDVRIVLNTILFKMEAQKLTLVATDGHRLSVAGLDLESAIEPLERLMPSSLIELLPRFLKGSSEVTFAGFGSESVGTPVEHNIFFKVEDGPCSKVLFGNALGLRYQNWQPVVQSNTACPETLFEINRDELLRALNGFRSLADNKAAHLFAEAKEGRLHLTVFDNSKKREELSTMSLEVGPITPFNRATNLDYFIDALSSFSGEKKLQIAFPFNETPPNRATILFGEVGGDARHYLMPTSVNAAS